MTNSVRSPSSCGSDAPSRQPHPRDGAFRSSKEKLTSLEFRTMLVLQGAHCALCPNRGPYEADHSVPLAFERGQKPDQLLCIPCHDLKTFGPGHVSTGDVSKIAKARRHAEGRTQYDKRKANGPQVRGRGFDKTKSKRMDGTVVDRG